LKSRWPLRRPRGSEQNATTTKSDIANIDIIIDTTQNAKETEIETGIDIAIVGETMKKMMVTEINARAIHATTKTATDREDTATTAIARQQTPKKISPSPTRRSQPAKTQSTDRDPSSETLG
jgi:hypothetical protein